MIVINDFEKNTETQMTAYFDTLHPTINKARFVVMFGSSTGYELSGISNYIKKHFMNDFEKYKYENIFCTVNATNKFAHGESKDRNVKCIYHYDTLMFDIDAKGENLSGLENQLVDEFLSFCEMRQFPAPNAFSYSGSGGIHLYYTIKPCYPGLGKAIKSLKYIMAEKISEFLDSYRDSFGMDYMVDVKVFDDMRMDRVPGTMNPKTGRMCEFFTTNVDRYTFNILLNYNDDIELLDWNRILKAAKNNYFYGKDKHTKIILSANKKKKPINRAKSDLNYKEDILYPMLKKRIDGFFKLADMGYDFKGARETSCFALRQICRNCETDKETEIELLHKLNECFYEPFNESFLLNHTDSPRQYKFSNEVLAAHLGLDVNDELFVKAFHAKPKLVKEYGLNKGMLRRAKTFLAVAGELVKDKNITIREMVNRTGYTLDQVKKASAFLRKDPAALAKWSTTTLDDYDFIVDYLRTHNAWGNTPQKQEKKVRIVEPKVNKDLVYYKKNGIVPSMGDKITIPHDILEPTPIKDAVTHRSMFLMGQLAMLKNEADKFSDRDPHHKRVLKLMELCQGILSAVHSFRRPLAFEAFLVNKLNIPEYNARRLVFGYFNYSSEFIKAFSDRYFGDGLIDNAKEPDITPMYGDQIKEFPLYKSSETFKYQPSTIYNHYYNIWNKDELILEYIPATYCTHYSFMHDLLRSYRMHRDNYKKFAKVWNVEMCNRSAEYAHKLIEEMHNCENEYYHLMKIEETNVKYFSEFDAIKINRELTVMFINKAQERSA